MKEPVKVNFKFDILHLNRIKYLTFIKLSGIQWNNIFRQTSPDDPFTLGHVIMMLIFDTIIYLLITLYVEAVFPGEYGVPLPWNFPFTYSFWCGYPRFTGK